MLLDHFYVLENLFSFLFTFYICDIGNVTYLAVVKPDIWDKGVELF